MQSNLQKILFKQVLVKFQMPKVWTFINFSKLVTYFKFWFVYKNVYHQPNSYWTFPFTYTFLNINFGLLRQIEQKL